jgi:hypothetical protein
MRYREEWTKDSQAGRSMRFQTSSNAGPGSQTAMKSRLVRKLPGTPLAVERVYEQLVREPGSDAIVRLRCELAAVARDDLTLDKEDLRAGDHPAVSWSGQSE